MRRRNELPEWAATHAARHMGNLGCRQQHVQRVALLASEVARAHRTGGDLLVAAAWLHDVGYAPTLAKSGFHPLDGARWLRAEGQEELAVLVAHHSGARYEASLRGFDHYLAEFPHEESLLDRALTYCDLTTGPDGQRVSLEWRIEEIQERYGSDHTVARAIRLGRPEFEAARDEVELLMAKAGIELTGSLAYPD